MLNFSFKYNPAFLSPSHFRFPLIAESHRLHHPPHPPCPPLPECPPLPCPLPLDGSSSTGLCVCASGGAPAMLQKRGPGKWDTLSLLLIFIQLFFKSQMHLYIYNVYMNLFFFNLPGFWARTTFLIIPEIMSLNLSLVPGTHQPSRSSQTCSSPVFWSTTCLILESRQLHWNWRSIYLYPKPVKHILVCFDVHSSTHLKQFQFSGFFPLILQM